MSDKQKPKGTKYAFATIGARTERGGRVTTGSGVKYCGLAIACVGDIVTYADGSEAVIMDGAGYASVIADRPAALVGSSLSNGDRIIETPWGHLDSGLFIQDGEEPVGLFDAEWVPPQRELPRRFAVRGSTTPRGGVLLEATSDWEVREVHRRAGRIGDFVQYRDGTRARIALRALAFRAMQHTPTPLSAACWTTAMSSTTARTANRAPRPSSFPWMNTAH